MARLAGRVFWLPVFTVSVGAILWGFKSPLRHHPVLRAKCLDSAVPLDGSLELSRERSESESWMLRRGNSFALVREQEIRLLRSCRYFHVWAFHESHAPWEQTAASGACHLFILSYVIQNLPALERSTFPPFFSWLAARVLPL